MTITSGDAFVGETAPPVAPGNAPARSGVPFAGRSPFVPTHDAEGGYLQSTMENTGAAFAVVDTALRIQDHNRALVEQCGRPEGPLVGRNICDLLHPSVQQILARPFERLIQRRSGSFIEHMTALWRTRANLSGTITGIANPGPAGSVESILLIVNSEEARDERRTLISPTKLLTRINAQIIEGVAAGAPTVQLASRLYLSRQGIEYHVSSMLRQFKVPNRAALVSKLYSMGLFKIGSWPPRVLTEYVRS
jgi:DNA-binding CsgD family transcriptional regulator